MRYQFAQGQSRLGGFPHISKYDSETRALYSCVVRRGVIGLVSSKRIFGEESRYTTPPPERALLCLEGRGWYDLEGDDEEKHCRAKQHGHYGNRDQ